MPINSRREKEIRKNLDDEIHDCLEQEKLNPNHPWNQPVKKDPAKTVSWKKALAPPNLDVDKFDKSEARYLWNSTPGVDEFLTAE